MPKIRLLACAVFVIATATTTSGAPGASGDRAIKRQASSDSPGTLYPCVAIWIENQTECLATEGRCICESLDNVLFDYLLLACADYYCSSSSSMVLVDATSISTFCETAWPAFVTSPLEQITSFLPSDEENYIITAASQSEAFSDDTFSTSPTAPPTSTSLSTDSVQTTNTPPSDENTGPGLSKEVQAGIGVGVSLGVLLLLGVGFFLGWRSRRKHGANRDAEPMSMSAQGVMDTDGASYGAKKFESMDGRMELESVNPPTHHEMYVPVEPKVELGSDPTRHL